MLFLIKFIIIVLSILNAYALTPQQKANVEKIQEKAKAYQDDVHAMRRKAITVLREESHALAPKAHASCMVGQCESSSSNAFHVNMEKDDIPYLMQSRKPIVFVSGSMPKEALQNLAIQARQIGAILVIKGFIKGTLRQTAQLVDDIHFPLEIDPKLFEKYDIHHVPTIMVYEKNTWHKIKGNVEIRFAQQLAKEKAS